MDVLWGIFQWFTGGDRQYMPSVHCMMYDYVWIGFSILLCVLNTIGYGVIVGHWIKQSRLVENGDAKESLRKIRNIFILCGVCGYMFIVVKMFWPAWRLFDITMVYLCYTTWSYAIRTRNLKVMYEPIRDNSDLRRQLQEQRDNVAYYEQLCEAMPSIVFVSAIDGKTIYINERWSELTGNDGVEWLDVVHPDDVARVKDTWDAAFREAKMYECEYRIRTRVGKYIWYLVRAKPMWEDGRIARWVGLATDIHERKNLEFILKNDAEQKRLFMNAISHDLRTPLNALTLQTDVAKQELEMGEYHGVGEAIEEIKANADAAADMLNSLLEFARTNIHECVNTLEVIDLSDTMRTVCRRLNATATNKGLSIRVSVPVSLPVRTDRQKIERIIMNLAHNGLKFTEKGGIEITAKTVDRDVQIVVADTGIGISPADQRGLFREFYQVSNYERDRNKGFGLGLAIVQHLVQQLGGDVGIESEPGLGSRFTVTIRDAYFGSTPSETKTTYC